MVRFGEKAPGQPVDMGSGEIGTVTKAGKEPDEPIGARPIDSLQGCAEDEE
jgi:hypothetical protein